MYIFKHNLFTHTIDKPFGALILRYRFMVVLNPFTCSLRSCKLFCKLFYVCMLLHEGTAVRVMTLQNHPALDCTLIGNESCTFIPGHNAIIWKERPFRRYFKQKHNHHWFPRLFNKEKLAALDYLIFQFLLTLVQTLIILLIICLKCMCKSWLNTLNKIVYTAEAEY